MENGGYMNVKNRANLAFFMLAIPVAFSATADSSTSWQEACGRMSERCSNLLSNNKKEIAQVAAVIFGWELTKLAYRRWIAPRTAKFFYSIGDWFSDEDVNRSRHRVHASTHVKLD
jgi:hypothetical protein